MILRDMSRAHELTRWGGGEVRVDFVWFYTVLLNCTFSLQNLSSLLAKKETAIPEATIFMNGFIIHSH